MRARAASLKSRLGALRASAARELVIRRAGRGPKLCLVTGNCQAEVLGAQLKLSPEFSSEYRTVRIRPVHEMSAAENRQLARVMPFVSLYVPHPVRDGYRDLVLGHQELAALARPGCRVIRVPPIYYEGTLPFQVNVHQPGVHVAGQPPLTNYHDLRILWAVTSGKSEAEAVEFLSAFDAPGDALRHIASASADRLTERDARVDVPVAEQLLGRVRTERSLYTVNHPDSRALKIIADGVLSQLGFAPLERLPAVDPLARIATPVEPQVARALELQYAPDSAWAIDGGTVSWAEVVRQHYAWYREYPGVPSLGVAEHAERLDALGLGSG